MPRQAIPISSGSMPATPQERARIAELDARDLMIPAASLPALEEVMRSGEPPACDFMLSSQLGDFSGLPPVHLVVGGDEVMLATTESIARACEQAGVEHTLTVGSGMWHCYPAVPVCPEARATRRQLASWLRGDR